VDLVTFCRQFFLEVLYDLVYFHLVFVVDPVDLRTQFLVLFLQLLHGLF
jgi:hypothetical protein